jgi:hypothetical protein
MLDTMDDEARPEAPDAVVLFAAVGVLSAVGRVTVGVTRRALAAATVVVEHAPGPLGSTVDELARRGRADLLEGVAAAQQLAENVAHAFAAHPTFVQIVNEVVDRVLPDAIDTALPAVFDRLVAQPEGVREVVRAQSSGLREELLAQVRTVAAAGDATVDRTVGRWRRGRRLEVPPKGELAFRP